MKHTTRPAALLAVLALVLTTWLTGGTPADDTTLVASGHHIDNTSKAAVRHAFRTRYAPTMEVPTRWTGSYEGCRAGAVSKKSRRATRKAVNFARAMGGLDPIRFTRFQNRRAQEAALIMGANRSLSHYPPRNWRCWTTKGNKGAQTGNLALRHPSIPSGRAIDQYMDDEDDNNYAVAHRRWILNPATAVMGTGSTDIANALIVVTKPRSGRATPRWIGWPTAGWFPNQVEPSGRWSLSSTKRAHDFSQAKVRVRLVGGRFLKLVRHTPVDGAGPNTVAWDMRARANRAHRVTVSNIRVRGTTNTVKRRYVVRLFDAR
ncbi:MAG: CAP domain-containing protein [Nocardioides sp.]|nr:CAP domain-containing protein [Nocardioides sp.]